VAGNLKLSEHPYLDRGLPLRQIGFQTVNLGISLGYRKFNLFIFYLKYPSRKQSQSVIEADLKLDFPEEWASAGEIQRQD
jgi:hypothetical protein